MPCRHLQKQISGLDKWISIQSQYDEGDKQIFVQISVVVKNQLGYKERQKVKIYFEKNSRVDRSTTVQILLVQTTQKLKIYQNSH